MLSHPETTERPEIELPPVAESPGESLPSRKGVYTRIPGNVVNRATQNLDDRPRSAIRRLHRHYMENDLNIREVAALVRVSETAISQIFNGKYNAKLDGIVKEIESFFKLEDSRAQGRKLPFTETDLTKRIFNVCEKTREFQKISFIFSDAQIGKSTALEEYQRRNNHGSTIYTYIPAGGSFASFLLTFCKPLGIAVNTGHAVMRHRIKESFDDRMLLIVDEAHQSIPAVSGMRRTGGLLCIEFIRELFNDKKCGIILCATNAFRDEMQNGDLKKLLAQTKRRRLCTLQLPNAPTQDDLDKFAAQYGLSPSSGADRALEKRIVADEALGMWLTLLRIAATIAAKRKEPMTWQHVHSADAAQKALEGKTH